MAQLRFKQVDVFTAIPFRGNPVAVVLDADGLSTEEMQRIAGWTNLSETTFVLKPTQPGADYLLRIFTPRAELPFAGHPTIGSAHAVLESGYVKPANGRLRQECGAGVLDLTVEGDRIWVTAPKATLKQLAPQQAGELAAALGAPVSGEPMIVHVGPTWLVADMGDAAKVDGLPPDMAAIAALSRKLDITGITVFGATGVKAGAEAGGGDAAVHVRSFAPEHGVPEDPVCGSGNISVAAFISASGQVAKYGASYGSRQGMQLGRDGRVSLRIIHEGRAIQLGGHAVTCVEGTLRTA